MKYKYIKTKDCRIVDVSECFIDEEQKYFINVRTGEKTPLSDAIKGTETLEEMGEHYIRTPSEIYSLDDLYVCKEINDRPYAVKGSGFCIYKESIVAEADTIEELCDELVLKDLDTGMCFVMNEAHIQDLRDNWRNLTSNNYLKNHTIYGAIWTDKGLIYVAKMNDKGKLELL